MIVVQSTDDNRVYGACWNGDRHRLPVGVWCKLCLPTLFVITKSKPFCAFAVHGQLHHTKKGSSCSWVLFRDTNGNWSWWPSWRPTSMSLLKTAEAKILACKGRDFAATSIAHFPSKEMLSRVLWHILNKYETHAWFLLPLLGMRHHHHCGQEVPFICVAAHTEQEIYEH